MWFSCLSQWLMVELTPICQTLMQARRGLALIIIVKMLRSSQIEMSSHVPFVWMVLHFYHSHMEPVWPSHSRTVCRPLTYLPLERLLCVTHTAHSTTRALPHCTSSLQLNLSFVSVHLLFITRLFALDFSQTSTVSGLHSQICKWLVALQIIRWKFNLHGAHDWELVHNKVLMKWHQEITSKWHENPVALCWKLGGCSVSVSYLL